VKLNRSALVLTSIAFLAILTTLFLTVPYYFNFSNNVYEECLRSPLVKYLKIFPGKCKVLMYSGYQPIQDFMTPKPSVNQQISGSDIIVNTPSVESIIKSPVLIKGSVTPGWMFEGSFPIKLLDSAGNTIAQVQAKELVPGSWQSGKWVDFEAKIMFSTNSGIGMLVLENDNPGGDPKNLKSFQIPIKFK
jgi:hypothetical protein